MHDECGRIIADLISWKKVASIGAFDLTKSIEAFFAANGGSIANRDILPVLRNGVDHSWGTPHETWAWRDNELFVMRLCRKYL